MRVYMWLRSVDLWLMGVDLWLIALGCSAEAHRHGDHICGHSAVHEPGDLSQSAVPGLPFRLGFACETYMGFRLEQHKTDVWGLGCVMYEMMSLR